MTRVDPTRSSGTRSRVSRMQGCRKARDGRSSWLILPRSLGGRAEGRGSQGGRQVRLHDKSRDDVCTRRSPHFFARQPFFGELGNGLSGRRSVLADVGWWHHPFPPSPSYIIQCTLSSTPSTYRIRKLAIPIESERPRTATSPHLLLTLSL